MTMSNCSDFSGQGLDLSSRLSNCYSEDRRPMLLLRCLYTEAFKIDGLLYGRV